LDLRNGTEREQVLMEKEIKIVAAGPEQLEGLIAVFNEGFHQKFGYVCDSEEKQKSFARDFGLIETEAEDKEFAVLREDRIVAYLSLRFKGQKGLRSAPRLSLPGMIRRYGVSGTIRATRMGIGFHYNPPAGELYIDTISVSAEARGTGIGSKLLEFAGELAAKRGLGRLSLMVMYENTRARALYERAGFKVVSRRDLKWLKRRGGYGGAYFMTREL
jgi:ribosomal protein S18 acetylase RimI-like enzyme